MTIITCALPDCRQVTTRRSSRISRITIPMIVAALILSLGIGAGAQSATIDFSGANRDWITGLGGGVVYLYGPTFTSMSTAMADDLFCNGTGQLGLSLLRISIDPGGEDPVPIMQGSPYTDGYGWAPEVGVAQVAQSEAASCASPGQVSVFATPWSVLCNPTTCYKTNGSVDGGYLITSDYSNFAGWLEDFVQYAQSQSVNLTAVSLQNEPSNPTSTAEFGYTDWTAAEFDNWFGESGVSSQIADDPYHTEIMFPETFAYANAPSADPALYDNPANIGILAVHCYSGVPALDPYATSLGIPEWQTECDHNETAKTAQEWTNAMDLATSVAQWMNAGYNAWTAWEIEDGGPTFPNSYWSLDPGFIYPNSSGNPVIEMKGYAMGQYSKWARPGYMDVSTTESGLSNVTAFQGDGNFAIVAVNNTSSSKTTSFTIKNAAISSLNVYQSDASSLTATSCTDCLASGSPSTVTPTSCSSNLCFTYDMPAYSIVTFEGTGNATAANMMPNPRFLTGDLAGWAVYASPGHGSDADVYVQKDTSFTNFYYSLQESDPSTAFSGWARSIITGQTASKTFTFTVYAKTNNTDGNNDAYVQILQNGTSNQLCETFIPGNSATWTKYTCSGTVPSTGTTDLLIRLAASSMPAGKSVDYDDPDITVTP